MEYKAAVLQLHTTKSKAHNLDVISRMIQTAAQNGATLVSLPETMNIIDETGIDVSEPIPGETTDLMVSLSKQYNVWIHGGSITEHNGHGGKPYNTTVMVSPSDGIIAKYRKLHLFDVDIDGGVRSKESDQTSKGDAIVVADAPIGRLGFSICYDIRFPELYRTMALLGAQVVFVPADFTYKTGSLHWEVLLRSRAIENNCFIVAAGQCGTNARLHAYGHSMIIDPNGRVLAQLDEDEGIAYAPIDLGAIEDVKRQIPSLENRREDLYTLRCHGRE